MNGGNDRCIAILTYNVPHRKTFDILMHLKARGFGNVRVFAQPMTYVKKRQPLINHRPTILGKGIKPRDLSKNLGYKYAEGLFEDIINQEDENSVFLLCGAGLLPESFVRSHRIINSHPGYSPYARGLDAYKWSIWNRLPIGVTTHILGEYVDAGEVIERRIIKVEEYDTFHSVAQRVYENEIEMLIDAIKSVDEVHEMIVPENNQVFKRMPENMERQLLERFEEYKKECRKQ